MYLGLSLSDQITFMSIKSSYLELPYDASGSRSKNRFRLELLWGISKIIDLMDEEEDFTVVFDYVCDIEIHFKDGLEFYQVKTHDVKVLSYEAKDIVARKKGVKGAKPSILGKLYALKLGHDKDILRLALVSNTPFVPKGTNAKDECLSLGVLKQRDRDILVRALKTELNIDAVDLSNVYFLHVGMNLTSPEDEVRGKLSASFERLRGSDLHGSNALWRLVFDTVKNKACFEYTKHEYDEIVANKGLSRAEFDQILDTQDKCGKTGIKEAEEFVRQIDNVKRQRDLRKALSSVLTSFVKDRSLQIIVKRAVAYLSNNDVDAGCDHVSDALVKECMSDMASDYTPDEKKMLAVVIIKRYVQGGYDDADVF